MELVQFYKSDINAVLHRRYAIAILLQAHKVMQQKVTSAIVDCELLSGQVWLGLGLGLEGLRGSY